LFGHVSQPELIGQTPLQQMQAEQRRLRDQINSTRAGLDSTRHQALLIQYELIDLDIQLEEALNRIENINRQLENTVASLQRMELELEQAQQDYDEQMELVIGRLRSIRRMGDVGYLEAILRANSFTDFLRRSKHVNTIAEHDRNMLDAMEAAERRVAQKLDEIFGIQQRIETQLFLAQEQQDELNRIIDEQDALLMKYQNDIAMESALLLALNERDRTVVAQITAEEERLERERRERERLAELARQNNLAASRAYWEEVMRNNGAILEWPLPGYYRISSDFGNRTHPITRRPDFHHGIDVGAPLGTPIIAVMDGVVERATFNSSYGFYVEINHGNGLSTLYAHNSRNMVREGQQVKRGETIALIGSTGSSTGPHIHFEVRLSGTRVDPKPYLGR
jgi:murein DD-endopeptidase MepM/ murein hydrolase activator NlpD/aryl carrier-like protein